MHRVSRDSPPAVFEALDGRLIHPRRALRDAWRFRALLAYWVRRNLIARYRQTTLGPIWAVLVPILSSLVYAFVFSLLLRVETGAVPYTLFAMTNLALWMYTTRALQTGPAALLGNLDLITRVRFPREFLPISVWLESLVDLVIGLAIVAVFAVWYGVALTPYAALAPVVLVIHSMLTVGLMLTVAAITVRVRDLAYILPISLQLALYLAPILYPIDLIPAHLRAWYLLNPFATIFAVYHETLYQGRFTLGRELMVCAAISLLTLAAGYRLFKRQEWLLADQL
jgi:ABC-type polysaccharide/polyol phosphate export permease